MSDQYNNRPDLFSAHKPLLTRKALADLLGVNRASVDQWVRWGKLKPASVTPRGGALFSFEQLAAALRETISLGFVPVLSKRQKRSAH